MAVTVDIIIKGAAICYVKDGNWKVLFPIDDDKCHKINFSFRKKDDLVGSTPISLLTETNDPINIAVTQAISVTGRTSNFETYVLDLTSTGTTHQAITIKQSPGRHILMTIPNADFSVAKYLNEFGNGLIPPLEEVGTSGTQPIDKLAHSVKGTIIMGDGGQISFENSKLSGGRFITDPNTSYVLTFDNNCELEKEGRNDMDMFYEVIEDTDHPGRKFRIGGVGGVSQPKQSEPPNYSEGKPCLTVWVSKPDNLP